jgi:hypothetical protein
METSTNTLGSHKMRNIYWSHLKMMRACPRQYLWHKGHPDHDLGAGYGKPMPLPEEKRESEHHQLMGTVLSKVVEDIYNLELYREPSTLMEKALEIARTEFTEAEQRHYVLWTYLTREQALDICLQGARNFLEIMKEHRFLGPYAKSELRMTPEMNKYFKVCGIADLVYRDKEGKVHILDGKNASTPMKYEDEDQLRWYALCFRLQYGVNPDRLGFFYFRYPTSNPPSTHHADPNKKWDGFVEVSITEDDIQRLGKEAIETNRVIHKGVFEPNPMPKHCRICKFENICPERQEQKKHNAAKRGIVKVDRSLPDPVKGADGFVDLNFK